MRASFAPLMALFATTVIAASIPGPSGLHLRRADEINWDEVTIVDLEVIDEDAFPGQVFSGTAETIVGDMKALKPELFADEDLTSRSASLERRADIDCSWYQNLNDRASIYGCFNAADYIKSLGTRACVVNGGTSTCARVACNNGCGLFLCNRTNGRVSVHFQDIYSDFFAVANKCADRLNSVSGRILFGNHFTGVRTCSN